MMGSKKIEEIEKQLGVVFSDKHLLKVALTHSSFARRAKDIRCEDNERLEFLGDAVLKLVISERLYEVYNTQSEGHLTKYRAQIISDKMLARLGLELNLGDYLLFSFGEKKTGGAYRESNVANAVEAILGAYYLDQGLDASRTFFLGLLDRFFPDWLSFEQFKDKDYKTHLQELVQKVAGFVPVYTLVDKKGPEHEQVFFSEIHLNVKGKEFTCKGAGKSIKESEQDAAKSMLEGLYDVFPDLK